MGKMKWGKKTERTQMEERGKSIEYVRDGKVLMEKGRNPMFRRRTGNWGNEEKKTLERGK